MSAVSGKGGLVLSGGGARGAYQAGVLKGLATIHREFPEFNPFRVITGISSGAVNTAYFAACTADFTIAADRLCHIWENLKPGNIFKVDNVSLLGNGARLIRTLMFGGKGKSSIRHRQVALLNTEPSRDLFAKNIDFTGIQKNIEAGRIDALALTAIDYQSSIGVTFMQAREDIPTWTRSDRFSVRAKIGVEHVMASAAIPIFFPSVQVGGRFFGDGCLRNRAPLSPAIKLGATKLLVIGVRKGFSDKPNLEEAAPEPGIGRILNALINSVLLDGMEMDLERMLRVNETLAHFEEEQRENVRLRPIDFVHIKPTQDIAEIAKSERIHLPRGVRYLLSGLGTAEETSDIVSYLLFEGSFCKKLVALGYQDCLKRKDEILSVFLAR